jgi:hypothetical protein
MDGHRCLSEANKRCPKAQHIADEDGAVELHALHADGDDRLFACPALLDFVIRSDGSSLIDVTQNNPAENCPMRIRISGHHDDFERQVSFIHGVVDSQLEASGRPEGDENRNARLRAIIDELHALWLAPRRAATAGCAREFGCARTFPVAEFGGTLPRPRKVSGKKVSGTFCREPALRVLRTKGT